MQIKKILLKNFGKYTNKDFEIEPITLIKGPNGSGKSTVLEGITFALTGSVRRLPKKLESLSKLSNTDGNVGVILYTNENVITRDIVVKGKKSSELITCTDCDPTTTNTEKQEYLKNKYLLDELLINPMNFISLTGADKSKYILELLNNINNSDKDVFSTIAKDFNNDPFILEFLKKNQKLCLVDNIDMIKDIVSDKKKFLNKELKSSMDTTFKISDLKNQIGALEIPKSNVISELEKDISDLRVQIKLSDKNNLTFKNSREELEKLKNSYPTLKKDINLLDKQIKELSLELLTLRNFKIDNSLQEKLSAARECLLSIQERGLETKSKIELVSSKINQDIELFKKVSNIKNSKRCVINNNIICNNSFDDSTKEIQKEIQKFKNEFSILTKERNVLVQKYACQKKKIDELNELYISSQKKQSENSNKIIELSSCITNKENERRRLSKVQEKFNFLEEQLNSNLIEDNSIQKKILESKELELRTLKINEKKIIELKHNLKLAEIEDKTLEEKTLQLEKLKALEKRLKTEKLKLLEEGLSPFIDKMDEIFNELGFNYKVFVKNDGKKATIGLTKDDRYIEIDMLSTGETMMFIIGLIGAIYSHRNSCFRFLVLDDLDNLDNKNLNILFKNSNKLLKYFDNIMLIGVLENINLNDYNLNTISL